MNKQVFAKQSFLCVSVLTVTFSLSPFLTHAEEVAEALLTFLATAPHPNPLPQAGEGAEQP